MLRQNAARGLLYRDLGISFTSTEHIPFALSFISLPSSFPFSLSFFVVPLSNGICNSISALKPFLTNLSITSWTHLSYRCVSPLV